MKLTKTYEDDTEFGPKEFGLACGIAAVAATIYLAVQVKLENRWYRRYRQAHYGKK